MANSLKIALFSLLFAARLEAVCSLDFWNGAVLAQYFICDAAADVATGAQDGDIRYNKDTDQIQCRNGAAAWVACTVSAPIDAEYVVTEANSSLSAEVAPSGANQVPVSSSSTAGSWTTVPDAALANNYSGVGTCTNQFARVLNDNAAPTCATVSLTADVSGTLPLGNGGTNNTAAAVQGAVVFSNSTQHAYTAAGSLGQGLYSAGTGTPTWSDDSKIVRLTADYTNATTTLTNTALTWTSPSAVSRSGFYCELAVSQSATTLGTQVDVNVTTAPTTISYEYRWVIGAGTAPATSGTEGFVAVNANATLVGNTAGLTTRTISYLQGVIVHTSTSTAVTVRAKASSAGTTTILSGSFCLYYVL